VANPEHVAKLKEGVEAWNAWRNANPQIRPYLSEANLAGANLSGANLSQANLVRANLRRADLSGANLSQANPVRANLFRANLFGANLFRANLSEADLSEANLFGAGLSEANLIGADLSSAHLIGANLSVTNLFKADLSRANLSGANLSQANLDGTDFDGAIFSFTVFGNTDLCQAKNLETVRHTGPSTVGLDTIYRSQGKIPIKFLRGAGVPENFVEQMPYLFAIDAIQFYSCFISYSSKDQGFADRLYADLQNKGVRCWFAPHEVRGGEKLLSQIDEAIRKHEKLLVILSAESIKSEWVGEEMRRARKREIGEGVRVLFPVRLVSFEKVVKAIREWALFGGKEGKDLASEIREYYIPDFSNWKNHDSYQEALEVLLKSLRPKMTKATPRESPT